MLAPLAFVAGSIRATDPVSLNAHTAVPSVASEIGLTTAMLAVGTIGVAGNGDSEGDGMADGDGVAVGDGVGLNLGPMPEPPPPSTLKPSATTRRLAVAASESRVSRPRLPDRRATRCHG